MTPNKSQLPSNDPFPPLEDLVSARSGPNDESSLTEIGNFPTSLINDRLQILSAFSLDSSTNSPSQATSYEISLPSHSAQRLITSVFSRSSALIREPNLQVILPTIARIVNAAFQAGNMWSAFMTIRFIIDGSISLNIREVRLAESQRNLAITAPPLRIALPSPDSENQQKTLYELAKTCVEKLKKIVYQSDHNDEEMCSICLEYWKKSEIISVLPCNHHLHFDCVVAWFTTKMTCPNCRYEIKMNELCE